METVAASELLKLFSKEYLNNNILCDYIKMNVEESNVNAIQFVVDKPTSKISKDIVDRAVKILKDTNTLIIKHEYEYYMAFYIFCKSDPILEKIKYVFSIINEYQTPGDSIEEIATLKTIKDEKNYYGDYPMLIYSIKGNDFRKSSIIATIDETKPIDKDIDIINLFRSEFDFNIKYDCRDTGYLLTYLKTYKRVYEQPTISREEAYNSYINFCDRNYLGCTFTKHIFGRKIKTLCNVIQKFVIDKQVRQYYLSSFGKSCLEDPEVYYALLKKEADKDNDPDDIAYSESFESYFEENRDSYKDYIFTKYEAYDNYKKFCTNNSYEPIPKKTFYRLMLNECIVKRSKEKNGSECFIIEKYSYKNFPAIYITTGVPDEYPKDVKAQMEKQIEIIKAKTAKIESGMKDFINHYHDDFKSYNYTRPEAFELYKSYCITNNHEPMGKLIFYKMMQKYCDEKRHRPSPTENPRTYFICRSEDQHENMNNEVDRATELL